MEQEDSTDASWPSGTHGHLLYLKVAFECPLFLLAELKGQERPFFAVSVTA